MLRNFPFTGKQETANGTTSNYLYTYNDKRQLTAVKKDNQIIEAYAYDANGNRTQQTSTARGINNQAATYNNGDQLITMGNNTYTYNADGYLSQKTTVINPTTTETTTYQYSSLGRLQKVTTPSKTIDYQHNALGNRVAKLIDGEIVEKYLWLDKIALLATYDKNDQLLQRYEYVLGNTPQSYTQNGNKYYIISDHLGTPRAITNEAGDILKQIDYDSFGHVISDTAPEISIPFGFAGGLADSDTGLIRFGYRDYDPETGRWTARDPIGFAGGDTNLYGYVLGDPVNFVDPSGLQKIVERGGPGHNSFQSLSRMSIPRVKSKNVVLETGSGAVVGGGAVAVFGTATGAAVVTAIGGVIFAGGAGLLVGDQINETFGREIGDLLDYLFPHNSCS